MADKNRLQLIYLRGYPITILIVSVISIILLLVGNFAWWQYPEPMYIRLSSTFRLSILIVLPLILAFVATGTIAGLIIFTDLGDKKTWNKLIFWISVGIFTASIIAAGAILITFSVISTPWKYGTACFGAFAGSLFIVLASFAYYRIKQDMGT